MKGLSDRFRIDRMPKPEWRRYRRNCQMVFQDAFASLNPRHLVVDIVGRPLRIHREPRERNSPKGSWSYWKVSA